MQQIWNLNVKELFVVNSSNSGLDSQQTNVDAWSVDDNYPAECESSANVKHPYSGDAPVLFACLTLLAISIIV